MKQVRLISRSPRIDLKLQMGEGPATLTTPGGWVEVPRPGRLALTDWPGGTPIRQAVPLLLDRFAAGRSVERQKARLLRLTRAGEEEVPPVFRLFGPVHYSGKHWVCESIEWGDNVIRKPTGLLVRQSLILNCMEYVRPDVIRERRRRRPPKTTQIGTGTPGAPGANRYTVKQGDTLVKIAKALYGDWKLWREIGRKNDISDPNKKLAGGRVLKL